jgi:hypothetical protein
VDDLISIEDGEEPIQRVHRVARTRRNVFCDDSPGILDGRNTVSWSGSVIGHTTIERRLNARC